MNKLSLVLMAAGALIFTVGQADAGVMPNGTSMNGTSMNGTSMNGMSLNGITANGVQLNGVTNLDARVDGIILGHAR